MRRLLWIALLALILALVPVIAWAAQAVPTSSAPPQLGQYQMLVGSLMPLLVAVVVRQSWQPDLKRIVAFGLCVLAGIGTAYLTGQLSNITDVSASVLTILVTAQLTYSHFWHGLGITDAIEASVNADPPGTIPAARVPLNT